MRVVALEKLMQVEIKARAKRSQPAAFLTARVSLCASFGRSPVFPMLCTCGS